MSVFTVAGGILSMLPSPTLPYISHLVAEGMFAISTASWLVHMALLSGFQTGGRGDAKAEQRSWVCSLESAHYVLMICSYPFCILHCYSARVYPTLGLMVILWVVWLCPIFFVRDLRMALQRHAAAQGLTSDGHAASAIKRGVALLSAMAFLLTETAACVGGDMSTTHHRTNCPEAAINLIAAQQLTHIYLFELIICDTGIASHADLLRCDRKTPLLVRVSAAVIAFGSIGMLMTWGARHSIPLYDPSRLDWAGDPSMNFGAVLVVSWPWIAWTPCVAMLFCRMRSLARGVYHHPLHVVPASSVAVDSGVTDLHVEQGKVPAPKTSGSGSGSESVAAATAAGGGDVLAVAMAIGGGA